MDIQATANEMLRMHFAALEQQAIIECERKKQDIDLAVWSVTEKIKMDLWFMRLHALTFSPHIT